MSMFDAHPLLIAIITVTFLLAGMVKGVIGMGLPTIAMGLLSTEMAPVAAASLLIVPSFVTNLAQMMMGPSFLSLLRRLWPMMLGITVGTVAGARLLTSDAAGWAPVGLGVVLIAYASLGLTPLRFSVPRHAEPWLSPVIGLITGVVTGATGVFVIPAAPYLQALGLEKEELVQGLGLSFTVSTIALALGLARGGAFAISSAGASFLALAPALLGMYIGQRVRLRVSPQVFRFCFFVGLIVLGLHLALARLLFGR